MKPEELKLSLKNCLLENWTSVEEWFQSQSLLFDAPLTGSIDIRDGGFKIAPVDANLYPAGWNNLCQADRAEASSVFKKTITSKLDSLGLNFSNRAPWIHVIPENHTKNLFYWENLKTLAELVRGAGFKVTIGGIDLPVDFSTQAEQLLETASGGSLSVVKTWIEDHTLHTPSGTPDLILVNNDFSSGPPSELFHLKQPVSPPLCLGWFRRSKYNHFAIYEKTAKEFCLEFKIDPFLLTPYGSLVEEVDFSEKIGFEQMAEKADALIQKLEAEYKEREIPWKPKVFVKSDSGTYGMGILVIESPDEILNLGRKARNKMDVVKNKLKTTRVLLQEGIPTLLTTSEGDTAEPVIYFSALQLVGGFLRANRERGHLENLNAKGMVFKKLCMAELRKESRNDRIEEIVYGTIARLSALSMAKEVEELSHLKDCP